MMFLLETLRLGLANLLLHKLRSLLTALGIIFGVSAVITMVAIGEGNMRKALADIDQLGLRNIIVRSVKPPDPATSTSGQQFVIDYGIRRRDLRRIEHTVQPVDHAVPLKHVGVEVSRGARLAPAVAFGTLPRLLEVTRLRVARGRYLTPQDDRRVDNVAVLGAEVAVRLFPLEDPLEGHIRIDTQVFKVVGVLAPVGLAGGAGTALVGRDLNFDVHIPLNTAKARFGDTRVKRRSGTMEATRVELSELYVQVPDESDVLTVADQIRRVLELEHADKADTTVIVPLELLEQAKSTQRMFNALMISIASISLLVGGIGIMNIMLATVTERTREIGVRRALGATRRHIVAQFLVETTVLSGVGGVIGVGLGIGATASLAFAHRYFEALERPAVTGWPIVVSFVVAVTVGIVFGLYPAIKAAHQDPIVALRHD